jgi:hypothetical protein
MSSSSPATTGSARDLRPASRRLAALLVPVGPAAVAALRFVLPYDTTDDGPRMVHQVAEHQTAENAVVWLGLVAMLTLVPSVLWVGRLVGRGAPRLTAAALLLLVPGYSVLGLLVAGDAAVLFGVRHGIPADTLGDLYESVHPSAAVGAGIFVVGHVLGTVLLGIAMLRGRTVPTWAGVATVVAQPLHFVAAVVVSSHTLDLAAWGLNAVGFAAVSLAILRLGDDEWAPRPRGATVPQRAASTRAAVV